MKNVRTFIFNEVSLIVAVVGVVMGVYLFLSNPTSANTLDIQLLKKDLSEIATMKADIKEIKDKQNEMDKKLDRAIFILETAVDDNSYSKF